MQQANTGRVGSLQLPTLGCQTLFGPGWSILRGAGRANTEHPGCAELTVSLLQVHNHQTHEYNPLGMSLLM